MKSTITALFLATLIQSLSAQNIDYLRNIDSKAWLKHVDKAETICEIPNDNWLNNKRGGTPWSSEEKLTFVLNGDLSNPQCLENLRALNRLQFVLNHIKVVYIYQSEKSYPSDLDELQAELNRYDIGIPVMMDTLQTIPCFPPSPTPTTTVISPYGKIMGTIDNWHDIDELIQLATEFTDKIMDVYNIRMQPFFGKTPSQKMKIPLLRAPMSIALDTENERIFVSDYMANKVLMLSRQGQLLEVIGTGRPFFKEGEFDEAALNGPRAVAYSESEAVLYIADARNRRIRKVDLDSLNVSTILGNGAIPTKEAFKIIGTHDPLPYPLDVTVSQNTLYISTVDAIWQMDTRTFIAEKISGSDTLNLPTGLSVDANGKLNFADEGSKLKSYLGSDISAYITPENGAGYQDGKKTEVMFNQPSGSTSSGKDLVIADQYNHAIRIFNTKKRKAETLSGGKEKGYSNGNLAQARYNLPCDIAKMGDTYYVTELGNNTIRTVNPIEGKVGTLAIAEYEKLSLRYKAPVLELNDGPSVKVNVGNNQIELLVDLGDNYQFDPNGKSYVTFTTRNQDALIASDDDLADGKISFDIELEEIKRPIDVTVDLFMYFKESIADGRVYFKQTAYIIILDPLAEKSDNDKPTIEIKLD